MCILLFKMSKCFVHREGTDVDAADKDGCTPLLVAARQGCSEAFAKLLEKADLCMTGKNRKNSVLLAAEADHSAVLMVSCQWVPDGCTTHYFDLFDTMCDLSINAGCQS